MILSLGFTRIFFFHIWCPNSFTTTLWSKEGKETEVQRHLLGRDTAKVQRLTDSLSSALSWCHIVCLEPEETSKEISSISSITKMQRSDSTWGDFPRPSLSLPSFHLSHSEASIWAASMYIGCTLQEIWETVLNLGNLLIIQRDQVHT